MIRLLLATLCLAMMFCVDVSAQDSAGQVIEKPAQSPKDAAVAEKQADIRRLLELTGAGALGKQVMDQMITQFRGQNANVPAQFWDEFSKELSTDGLVEMTVGVYDKYLSHDDIRQLIRFYESPVGRKLIKVQPLILRDSMQIGGKWGQEVAQKVVKKLQAEGFAPPAN